MDNAYRFLKLLTLNVSPTYKVLEMEDREWRKLVFMLLNDGMIAGVSAVPRGDDFQINNFDKVEITDNGIQLLAAMEDNNVEESSIKSQVEKLIQKALEADDFTNALTLSEIYSNLEK